MLYQLENLSLICTKGLTCTVRLEDMSKSFHCGNDGRKPRALGIVSAEVRTGWFLLEMYSVVYKFAS